MSRFIVCTCLIVSIAAPSTLAHAAELIAHYPLQGDALDATGNYDPITLENAPFQLGGVYCSGIYPSNPGGCLVETPWIDAIDFESLAIAIEFMVGTNPESARPIVVGGHSYRWMGIEHALDLTIVLLYNNSNRVSTDVVITPNVWHDALMTYDGATDTGSLYLDSEFVTSIEFVMEHGSYRNITTTHFGSGFTFKGFIRNLRVYDEAFVPTPVESSTWGGVKASFR